MGRWLVAVVIVMSALAVGVVAFLNGGEPVTIRLTPLRTTTLALGPALAIAFAAGAALTAAVALGSAALRSWRGWRTRRT
ncbi:MAG: hypothetical protein ACREQL_11385, partial [Candidatus Binatia bacterium]